MRCIKHKDTTCVGGIGCLHTAVLELQIQWLEGPSYQKLMFYCIAINGITVMYYVLSNLPQDVLIPCLPGFMTDIL